MTVERVSAERSECLQRIEQRALQERLEAEKRQVTLTAITGSAADEVIAEALGQTDLYLVFTATSNKTSRNSSN